MFWKRVSRSPLASLPKKIWPEEYFSAMETFSADRHDVSVWELVCLLRVNFRNRFQLCVVIQTNVTQFLDDIPNNLPLRWQ